MNSLYELFDRYSSKVLLYSNYWDDEKTHIDFEKKELVLVNEEDEYEFHLIFNNELELSKLLLEDVDYEIPNNQKISDSFYYDFIGISLNGFKILPPDKIFYKGLDYELYSIFEGLDFDSEKNIVEFLDNKNNIKKFITTLSKNNTHWYEFIIYNLDIGLLKKEHKNLLESINNVYEYIKHLNIENLKLQSLHLNVYGQINLSFNKKDVTQSLNKNDTIKMINKFMSIYNEFIDYGKPFVNVKYNINDKTNILNITHGDVYNEKEFI